MDKKQLLTANELQLLFFMQRNIQTLYNDILYKKAAPTGVDGPTHTQFPDVIIVAIESEPLVVIAFPVPVTEQVP